MKTNPPKDTLKAEKQKLWRFVMNTLTKTKINDLRTLLS